MIDNEQQPPGIGAFGVALVYAICAATWILLSDTLVESLLGDAESAMRASTLKGWLFVAVTSLVLYALLRRRWPAAAPAGGTTGFADLPLLPVGLFTLIIAVFTAAGVNHAVRLHHGILGSDAVWVVLAGVLLWFVALAGLIVQQQKQRLAVAEAARQSQEERLNTLKLLEAIADNSEDAIFAKDIEGRYILFNQAASRFVGKPVDEVLGRDDRAIFPPEQAEMLMALGQRAIAEDRSITFEESLSTAEGERIFLATKAPLRDAENRLIGVFGVSRDITERKRADASLIESEARFRTLSDAAQDAIVMIDPSGTITHWNPGATRLFGYSAAEGIGRSLHDFLPAQAYRAAAHTGFDKFRADGQGAAIGKIVELMARHKDGHDIAVELAVSAVRREDGWHAIGIVRDIGARKAAEAQLRKLSLAVEQSPASIVITDLDANIEYANPAFTRVSGYRVDEVLHQNPRVLHSGKTPRATYESLWASLSQGKVWQGEFINRRKDGSEYAEMAIISPVRQADGRVTHYLAIKQDITAQKRMEAELTVYQRHLEELVEDRTAELLKARLHAEHLARVKSEFLANMSHEIRTPLNAVIGFAQIGQRDSEGRMARDTFTRILDSGQLLLDLINDILDFSKMEAGKLIVESIPVDLREVIRRSADLVRDRAEDKGLIFRVETSADLPATVRGDALRLTQVLGNLLTNAVKFTEAGLVTLAATTAGERLVFSIIDTGIGMSADQIERLFSPFEQADGSTTRKYGGTGLGLAISRRLVDMLGGEIRVSSQPGEGSRFDVELPLVDPVGLFAAMPPVRPGAADVRRPGGRLRDLTLLAAEDNEVNRLVLEDMLTGEGSRVELVEDGRQVLERLQSGGADRYDIVLMDIQMPVMDGYEATHAAREIAPDLPIVGLTAHALPEERQKCLDAGMVAHLAKPIRLDELVQTILQFVRPAETVEAPACPEPAGEDPPGQPDDWQPLLKEYAGREALLNRLLATVRHSHGAHVETLRQAARTGDFARIAFLGHSLKGMSGQILPARLQDLARSAESAAKAESETAMTLADSLAAGLSVWLDELAGYLDSLPEEGPASIENGSAADRQEAADVLARLGAYLDLDDTRAGLLVDEHRVVLKRVFGGELDGLRRQIDQFDFEAARRRLQGLREQVTE